MGTGFDARAMAEREVAQLLGEAISERPTKYGANLGGLSAALLGRPSGSFDIRDISLSERTVAASIVHGARQLLPGKGSIDNKVQQLSDTFSKATVEINSAGARVVINGDGGASATLYIGRNDTLLRATYSPPLGKDEELDVRSSEDLRIIYDGIVLSVCSRILNLGKLRKG